MLLAASYSPSITITITMVQVYRKMVQLMLVGLVLLAAFNPVLSFCFHSGGGVGEYHGTCSDSIGTITITKMITITIANKIFTSTTITKMKMC